MGPHRSQDEEDSSGDESSHSSSSEASARSGGGGSPARSRSESRSRSRSRSSGRSASKSPASSHHSRSRSRSASSYVSGAGSNAVDKEKGSRGGGSSSEHSGEESPSRSRSRSGSSERSGTPTSRHSRSRSRSESGNESDAVSKNDEVKAVARNSSSERSVAQSPARSRSRSRSASERSGTKSPTSRHSRSRSHSENESVVESVLDESKKQNSEPPADSTQLFGDADDISDDDDDSEGERKTGDTGDKKEDEDEDEKKEKKSDDEDEEPKEPKDDNAEAEEPEAMEVEEDPLPETRIDVEIPKITTDLGKGIHFVKLPNFLSVETRPFDPNTYEDEIDEEETLDEEGRARLKLKVENTIRWRERFNEKGVFVKESNARFVKWSDGSLSLHLGSEIFNVHKQPLQGDHNHLFIRQGTGLQGQAVFRTKLTFRPHSTESFTHRKMTMSLADRSQKTSGIKVLSMVGHDPEAQRFQMIKKEEDKLRASVRRENKQRRVRERAVSRGLTSSYLEPDRYDNDEFSDEDNTISLSAIKNRYKKNAKLHSNIYSSEDEENDDEEGVRVGKKSERPKRLKDSDEESDRDDKHRDASSPGKEDYGNSGSNSD